MNDYMNQLSARLGKSAQMMRLLELKARKAPKRIVVCPSSLPKTERGKLDRRALVEQWPTTAGFDRAK